MKIQSHSGIFNFLPCLPGILILTLVLLSGCASSTPYEPDVTAQPDTRETIDAVPASPPLPEGWKADPDPERYEGPVSDYDVQYAPGTLPKKPIVFAGSSSFAKWTGLEALWSEYRVLNRGFGGSQMSDLIFYFDRLILANDPRQVFVYEGDNDIEVGKPTAQVQAQYEQFGSLMKSKLPGVPVVFLAVKPSISRWSKAPLYRKLNTWIKEWAETQGWQFADTWAPILGADGKPDPLIFEADKLHLNKTGYEKWIPVIEPFLKD